MRRSLPIVVVTTLAFVWSLLWPEMARARATPAPPPAPVAADADLASAKQHFEAGKAAYNAADYPRAIREFKAAEALRPSPILAYNIGLANEKLGRKRVAVRYFKRYLEGAPAAANRAEVDGRIAALEQQLAAQPQNQPPEQAQDNPPPPMVGDGQPTNAYQQPTVQPGQDPYAGQPMTTAPPRTRRNLWWVWMLVGIGAAAVVTAIVVVAVIYGDTTTTYYGRSATVNAPNLNAARRSDVYDHSLAAPPVSRGAEVAPLLSVHF